MASEETTITVKVNAVLAATYWSVYDRAFGCQGTEHQDLADFIAGFVEDRLADEIEFTESEVLSRK